MILQLKMNYDQTKINDALTVIKQYLDSLDTAILTANNPKTLLQEQQPTLEQLATRGEYAQSLIEEHLFGNDLSLYGTVPPELPTPYDNPHHREEYAKQAVELYDALVSEKGAWELLPEEKRNKERVDLLTTRIKELDEYFFARAVLDATFG